MIAVCVDSGNSTVLVPGTEYFVFEHGDSHYFASRFKSEKSHFGCFSKSNFQLQEHLELDPEKVYQAGCRYAYRGHSFVNGRTVYLKLIKTMAKFYYDQTLNDFGGCLQIDCFVELKEIEPIEAPVKEPVAEEILPMNEWQQLKQF